MIKVASFSGTRRWVFFHDELQNWQEWKHKPPLSQNIKMSCLIRPAYKLYNFNLNSS